MTATDGASREFAQRIARGAQRGDLAGAVPSLLAPRMQLAFLAWLEAGRRRLGATSVCARNSATALAIVGILTSSVGRWTNTPMCSDAKGYALRIPENTT